MERFVTITNWQLHRDGSNYAFSSRTKGKAFTFPQKQINKGFNKRQEKYIKMTINVAKVKSFHLL